MAPVEWTGRDHDGWSLLDSAREWRAHSVRRLKPVMVQILFTPFADNQRTIDGTGGIPDLTLRRDDVVAFWRGPSLADHITRAE